MVAALLDSARALIAERGPDVAFRDIAEHAGVNFGLIYQYVGTKEQLVREVYVRAARDAAGRLADAQHLDEALAMLMTFGDGATARLVGWAVLSGMHSEELFRDSPALDVLADLARADASRAGGRMSIEGTARVRGDGDDRGPRLAAVRRRRALAAGLDGARPERYDDRIREHLAALAAATTGTTGTTGVRTPPRRGTARSSR